VRERRPTNGLDPEGMRAWYGLALSVRREIVNGAQHGRLELGDDRRRAALAWAEATLRPEKLYRSLLASGFLVVIYTIVALGWAPGFVLLPSAVTYPALLLVQRRKAARVRAVIAAVHLGQAVPE
jgi:hypothetical protein